MANTHSTLYLCPCGWSGYFPLASRQVIKDWIYTVEKWSMKCPDCKNKITDKNAI